VVGQYEIGELVGAGQSAGSRHRAEAYC
jgi:hypothetical protein